MSRKRVGRRPVLAAVGSGLSLSLAGCLGTGDDSSGDETDADGMDDTPNGEDDNSENGDDTRNGEDDTDDNGDADDNGDDDGTVEPETGAEIQDIAFGERLYGRTETVEATVTISNIGPDERTIWVGFAVIDAHRTVWDGEATTHQSVTIAGEETTDLTVRWEREPGAPTGSYDAVIALWDERIEREGESDLLDGELDRRSLDSAFVITEARQTAVTDSCPLRGDALYLWGQAREVITGSVDEFTDEMHCLGISEVFISWGALPEELQKVDETNGSDETVESELAAFGAACGEAAIEVSVLWGEEWGMEGIERLQSQLDAMAAHGLPIHLDLEPHPDEREEFDAFLDAYGELLNAYEHENELSAFLAAWWFSTEETRAIRIRDHEALSWVAIAAYRNTEETCRERLELGLTGDPENPYYATFEFQSPAVDVVDSEITFWEKGATHAMAVLEAIASDPPTPQRFRGICLHEYGSVTDEQYR